MFCTKCGKQNADDAETCASCGTPLKNRQSGIPVAPANTELPKEHFDDVKINSEDLNFLNDFNLGAFANPTYYTLGNRIWSFALIMICIYLMPFFFFFYLRYKGTYKLIEYYFWAIVVIRLLFSFYLGLKGTRLAWESGRFTDARQFRDMQRVWNIVGTLTLLALLSSFLLGYTLRYIDKSILSRREGKTFLCFEQLEKVKRGFEAHISEAGDLLGVLSEDEVCHQILPGFTKPEECVGMVKSQVENVCRPGSFRASAVGEIQYEIKAKTNDNPQCSICVTEYDVLPLITGTGGCPSPDCVHE